jgi:hypothetical protein
MLLFSAFSRVYCQPFVLKLTDVARFPRHLDLGNPFTGDPAPMNARHARRVSNSQTLVAHIFYVVNGSKIDQPVVASNSVLMIDLVWPRSVHVKPDQAVCHISLSINRDA